MGVFNFNVVLPDLFAEVAPMMVIFLSIISSLRIAWLVTNRQRFVLYKELLSLLFILYILALFYAVTFQDINYGDSNFVLFKEITRYEFGTPKFWKNNIGNIIIFMPYAFFVAYYLKTKSPWLIILMTFIASLSIEITQRYLVQRVFDVDDVLLNVIGGIIGFYLFRIIDKIEERLPRFMKKEIVINTLVLILITILFIYLLNLVQIEWSLPWIK